MIVAWRGKKIAWVLAIMLIVQVALSAVLCVRLFGEADTSLVDFTIVIDAGHGGVDGGVTGKNGTVESQLNLVYAKALGEIFTQCGFRVVYTRTGEGGLYGLPTTGFKRRDMEKRRDIILQSKADIVISVHMNKYSDSNRSGAQVFFQQGSLEGKSLADNIQASLNLIATRPFSALGGDFYICRCSEVPSVIVECGFLSNVQEELLLNSGEYRQKIVESIFGGVMLYLYSL